MPVIKPTFKSHKARWENCTKCDLCKTRKHVVFARGTIPCDVLFVGEAPGQSEDVIGKPFVGPAGKLLNSMIEDVTAAYPGISYGITNLVGCLPYKTSKSHEPTKEQIEACLPKLREFICFIARPKAIIMVGDLSSEYVPIVIESLPEKVRPQYMEHIYHPAFILRSDITRRGLLIQTTTVKIGDVFEELSIPF